MLCRSYCDVRSRPDVLCRRSRCRKTFVVNGQGRYGNSLGEGSLADQCPARIPTAGDAARAVEKPQRPVGIYHTAEERGGAIMELLHFQAAERVHGMHRHGTSANPNWSEEARRIWYDAQGTSSWQAALDVAVAMRTPSIVFVVTVWTVPENTITCVGKSFVNIYSRTRLTYVSAERTVGQIRRAPEVAHPVIFQMAEVAVTRILFREILDRIRQLCFLTITARPG